MKTTIYLSLTLVLNSLLALSSCKPKSVKLDEPPLNTQVEVINDKTQQNIIDHLIDEIKLELRGFSMGEDTLVIITPYSGRRLTTDCDYVYFSKNIEELNREPNVFYNKKLKYNRRDKNNVYMIDILGICKTVEGILKIEVFFNNLPDTSPMYRYTFDPFDDKVIKKEFQSVIIE